MPQPQHIMNKNADFLNFYGGGEIIKRPLRYKEL